MNLSKKGHYLQKTVNLQDSYFFYPGDKPLLSLTIGKALDKAALESSNETSFIIPHQNLKKSFSEFKSDVDKFASGLIALGLCSGDRIAICCPNIYEWPVTQFAAAKAGLILVNINPALQASEIEYSLSKAGCKAIITIESYRSKNYYDILLSLLSNIGKENSKDQCSNNRLSNLSLIILVTDKARSGIITFNDVYKEGTVESDERLSKLENEVNFDDPVNIQFTSGTTGFPKGATLTHHNVINDAYMIGKRLGYLDFKPTLCCQVPLFHCFGCVIGNLISVLFQYTCVYPSEIFDIKASIKAIVKEKCTVIYGTPTMFVDLLSNCTPEDNVSSLNQIVVGGAPCPENVIMELKTNLNIKYIHNIYGTTENSPISAMNFMNDSESTIISSELCPMDFVEMKVVDDENRMLPVKVDGEICTRGYIVFPGYWDDDKKTKECIDEKNWYHTGDVGHMKENGYIKITGRKKDMILRGGENIYPVEVENFLQKHSSISEIYICGVPDVRMGEEMCAWIKVKPGEELSEVDIKTYCKGKIANFKIPRYIIFVEEFPKTTSGKIKKFEMRNTSVKTLSLNEINGQS